MSEESPNDEDSGGIFCQNCTPTQRKWGYYITFAVGALVFGLGLIGMFGGENIYLIGGSVIILLTPLWIKSCSGCVADMKNALRLTSTLIFFILLVINILFRFAIDHESFLLKLLYYIAGICLGVAGLWYFLSFVPNGQKACLACLKSCCGNDQTSGSA